MTHDEVVTRAVRWLRNTVKCGVVVHEFHSGCIEYPDAIGWKYCGRFSYLVECKISITDFRADKQKRFRKEDLSAGQFRYYMTPDGLLKPEWLPPCWGLLEIKGNRVRKTVEAKRVPGDGRRHEIQMMYSALYRHGFARNILIFNDAMESPWYDKVQGVTPTPQKGPR